jgi:hypothetical protein
MVAQPQPEERLVPGEGESGGLSQEKLNQILQPIMANMQQQVQRIIREQVEQAEELSRGDGGQPLDQTRHEAHGNASPSEEQGGPQTEPAGGGQPPNPSGEVAESQGPSGPSHAESMAPAQGNQTEDEHKEDSMTTEVETRPSQDGQEQGQPQAQQDQQDEGGRQDQPQGQAGQQDQPEGQSGQQGQEEQDQQDDGQKDPLVALLRQQIIDAMDPVMDDLRENIEQAVQQHVQQAIDLSQDDLHKKVEQAIEPIRHEVQSQVDQTVQDAKQEQDKPPQTSLQKAITRTVKALKQTMQWLARTLRALLKTVVALLKAVVNLVIVILLALFEGLKTLGGAAGGAVKAIGGSIMNGLKKTVLKAGQGLVDKLIPEPDSDKQDKDQQEGKQQSAA